MTSHAPSTYSGEAGPCVECSLPAYPTATAFRHGTRCGVILRNLGEPCARRVGHDYEHRSAYAMATWTRPRVAA